MKYTALLAIALPLCADDFFENQVRPLLASRCYSCHAQTGHQ